MPLPRDGGGQLLKQMKEHACRIKYSRGDWNKLSHFRSWNMFREKQPKPPMEIESLRLVRSLHFWGLRFYQ